MLKPVLGGAKKPRVLPGGISKKERHKWKSAKGELYKRRKISNERKKEIIKQVYVWGMGNTFVNIRNIVSIINEVEKGGLSRERITEKIGTRKELFTNAFQSLELIEKHFKKIKPLIQGYRNDPEFQEVFMFQEKLPRIRNLLESIQKNHSTKKAEEIMTTIANMFSKQKFRQAANRYNVINELAKEKQHGFEP